MVTRDWKHVRLLVFDLDGTLVDSKQDLALSINAMRREMGLAPLTLDVISSYVGHGVTMLVPPAKVLKMGWRSFFLIIATTCSTTPPPIPVSQRLSRDSAATKWRS